MAQLEKSWKLVGQKAMHNIELLEFITIGNTVYLIMHTSYFYDEIFAFNLSLKKLLLNTNDIALNTCIFVSVYAFCGNLIHALGVVSAMLY